MASYRPEPSFVISSPLKMREGPSIMNTRRDADNGIGIELA